MTRLRIFQAVLTSVAALMLSTGQAWACGAGNSATFFHRTIPEEPNVVVEVEITASQKPDYVLFEARIIRKLSGPFSGAEHLIAKILYLNSCDTIPRIGDRGIVAGNFLGRSAGTIIIEPVRNPTRGYPVQITPLELPPISPPLKPR